MNTNRSTSPISIQAGLSLREHPGAFAVLRPRSSVFCCVLCLGLLSVVCGPAAAQNQTINGNLTVTGTIGSAGAIDSDANTFSFGAQGGSYGGALIYQDSNTDTFTFSANRNPASWLWLHTTAIAAMRLDASHQLILYKSDGASAGVTLMPASNAIKLGAHANGTLTADANGVITAGGGFAVTGNFTNTNASATTAFMGNVGIGSASPQRALQIGAHDVAGVSFESYAASPNAGALRFGDNTGWKFHVGRSREAAGGALNAGAAGALVTFQDNGNVGIGTTAPATKLDVNGNVRVGGATAAYGTLRVKTGGDQYAGWFEAAGSNAALAIRPGPSVHIIQTDYSGTQNLLPLAFNIGGAEAMRIAATGNVGIGRTAPNSILEVGGRITLLEGSRFWSVGAGRADGTSNGYPDGAAVTNGSFAIRDVWMQRDRLRIDVSGNVGIGTTTPTHKLHVVGTLLSDHPTTPGLYMFNGAVPLAAVQTNVTGGILNIGDLYGAAPSLALGLYTADVERLRIDTVGNVGIGTTTPTHKLAVNGTIRAKEVIVDTGWADYVFEEDYRLAPLAEVEQHIREKKHLPGVPSAAEVEQGGVSLGNMQATLLAKVEELTLHLIAQEKGMMTLRAENAALRERVQKLESGAP